MKQLLLISFLLFPHLSPLHSLSFGEGWGEAFGGTWIGAITRQDAHLPEGRTYQGVILKQPAVKAAWASADTLSRRSIYLRKTFRADKQIAKATVSICGLGHYVLWLNGRRVGDSEFAPLWSDYDKTVYYNEYDVTAYLKKDGNVAGVLLGNGFYNVQGGRYRKLLVSFGPPTLCFRLLVTYIDGTTGEVCSDAGWKYALSPVTFNCIYGGEDYDARLEQEGWNKPGFDDSDWKPVVIQEPPKGRLTRQTAPPVKIMEHYTPQSVHRVDSVTVFDMGQNLAGFPEITLRGKRGQKITLRTGETLAEDGTVDQRQTGRPHYYQYTLRGEGRETWHPHFSYYGYRYIQAEGDVSVIKNIQSCFVYDSVEKVSTFECSNELFNQTHRLIEKAVRSNMQAIFTDCPHREKLGWLEQVHLNGPGLFYNYDLRMYIPKIMQDMADAQSHYPNGMVPTVAPQYVVFTGKGMDDFADSPEWGSSLVIVPFMYYDAYNDSSLIVKYYRQMRDYVDYLTSRSVGHILSFGLGDWYDYGNFRAGFSRNTPVPLVATAHYYMDIRYLAKAAVMVGNAYDAAYYDHLAGEVRQAFNDKFFDASTCRYGSGSQCSYSLPLFLDLVDGKYRGQVLHNLVADIEAHGNRLTTGDIGNRYLFRTLADNNLDELMYTMHNHYDVPGYGYQIKSGATTLTEQWDPRQGASWNHFMMGQIDEWFFRSLAGIRQEPGTHGYRHLKICPRPVGDLTYVKASYKTPCGMVSVEWRKEDGKYKLKAVIPKGCTAKVDFPGEKTIIYI